MNPSTPTPTTIAPQLAAAIREHLHPNQALAILAEHRRDGRTPEQIADDVVDAIDALIPWAELIPGWGVLIESADGPVIKALVHLLMGHHAAHGA